MRCKISGIVRLESAWSLKTWGLHIINVCSIKAGKMLSQVSKMGTSLFRPKASWISNALTPNTTLKCQRSKMAFYLEFASKTDIFYQKVLFGLYVWLLLPLRCVLYRDLCQKRRPHVTTNSAMDTLTLILKKLNKKASLFLSKQKHCVRFFFCLYNGEKQFLWYL